MTRSILLALTIVLWISASGAQEPLPADSARASADTMFVIPAGPVAGSFTSAARVAVLDTIAGWAKIQVEGWVPVQAVADRLSAPANPFTIGASSPSLPAPRSQCEAITKKGARCSRRAQPGSRYCWQHQPK